MSYSQHPSVSHPHADVLETPDFLAALRRQDPDAFEILYARHVSPVYRYVYLRVSNAQEAEDITAEVFVRAWRELPSFEYRGVPILAWLLRIAYNLVADFYRRQGKGFWERLGHWIPGRGDREFRRIEDQDVIKDLFAQLSYEQQTVLYLNLYEGYSLNEIADMLGKTPNAVRVIKHRAIRQLNQKGQRPTR